MALDISDERPAYVQVADALRAEIQTDSMSPGQRLPSVRELAGKYRIAPMTVRNAIRVLRDEGLVVARQGSGVFVRETAPGEAAADPVTEELDRLRAELAEMRDRLATTDQVESAETASPEYVAIMERLDVIQADLRQIDDRVGELEELAKPIDPR